MSNYLEEFSSLISEFDYILNNDEFLELKNFRHHYSTTRYQHCLNVAFCSFVLAKKMKNKKIKEIVKGALLHDFFLYEWREVGHNKDLGFLKGFHAFYHPYISLENAEKYFSLNSIEKDIILSHMFPCCLGFPKYKESLFIIIADKWCSVGESIFKYNSYKLSIT